MVLQTARERLRVTTLRRLAAGAWQIPAALVFLIQRPGLWPFVLLPAAAVATLVVSGLITGAWLAPRVQQAMAPGERPLWVEAPAALGAWLVTPLLIGFVGFACALALTGGLLDQLSRQVERRECGRVDEAEHGLRWDVTQSLRALAYFGLRAPGVLLLGLIPLLGPLLAVLWAGHAMAVNQTDGVLARRGLDFEERRAWHRRLRLESLGFGLAAVWTLLIPIANLLLLPLLAIGATLLVLRADADRPA
jgi:uncharacterized protein involved in cysteine biosynthesis